MNMMLLFEEDFETQDPRRAVVTGRRLKHLRKVIRPAIGDTVTVGRLGGALGEATLLEMNAHEAILDVSDEGPPPPPSPITLLMALPRPKSLFKILQPATILGVKAIHFFNASRVDKSYWQSNQLHEEALREHLIVGLEQARDTVLPTLTMHRLFSHFVNDALPHIAPGQPRFVAHPTEDAAPCPHALPGPAVVAIGPERGFIDYEVRQLQDSGFQVISLGPRILRVELAMISLLSRLSG